MAMEEYSLGARPGGGVIKTVRTFFPETWVWKLAEVGWGSELLNFHKNAPKTPPSSG